MDGATQNDRLIRFSIFEVDRASGELFKQGRKVKLQGQPFELLLALLERPGSVVTREELRQRVWPSDTAGDFDHGLNRAVNKVREALGDSAESPRFIETVPRRGYRFIGALQEELQVAAPLPDPPLATANQAETRAPRRKPLFAVAIAAALLGGLSFWTVLHHANGVRPIQLQQLTTNSPENPVWGAVLSPDGRYIAYGEAAGIKVRLISTGETHLLPRPATLRLDEPLFPAAWFPDGTRILALAQGKVMSCWSVSVIGASATKIRDNAQAYSVSPDGSLIAFTTGKNLVQLHNMPTLLNSEIWVMGARGENARKLIAGDDRTYFGAVAWSPDGHRIAYRKLRFTNPLPEYTIESRALDGGPSSVILSRRGSYNGSRQNEMGFADQLAWMPEGRLIYAQREPPPNTRDRNLWAIAVNPRTGRAQGDPRRITNLSGFGIECISATADGRRLIFSSGTDQSQLYVARILPGWKLDTPKRLTFDERYNSVYTWTADSKAVLFASDRTGTYAIYKQALDQNEAELIPTGPESVGLMRASPDGQWLLYYVYSNARFPNQSESRRFFRVLVSGGAPEPLFEIKSDFVNFDCPRRGSSQCLVSEGTPDSRRFVFDTFDPLNGLRHRLFEIAMPLDRTLNWTISPDASHIAMVGADPHGRIEIRSLSGVIERAIEVNGWSNPLAIDWAADSRSFFVYYFGLFDSPGGPVGTSILRVDFDGHVQRIWQTRGGRRTWAVASPDGKYVALREPVSERNVWMMENF
jgi:DNA-binding winged helix-turn-helix (wHTH) protein/Tol biopolymer transport system component